MKLYTTKAVARLLDLSGRRVRQLRDQEVITEARPGLYDLLETNHKYLNYLRKRTPEAQENLDYNTERAKLVRAKRQLEEYELWSRENKLHAAEEVEAALTKMLANFKARLLAIPAKLTPILSKKTDRAEIFGLLKEQIDEALLELSDYQTIFGEGEQHHETSDR